MNSHNIKYFTYGVHYYRIYMYWWYSFVLLQKFTLLHLFFCSSKITRRKAFTIRNDFALWFDILSPTGNSRDMSLVNSITFNNSREYTQRKIPFLTWYSEYWSVRQEMVVNKCTSFWTWNLNIKIQAIVSLG